MTPNDNKTAEVSISLMDCIEHCVTTAERDDVAIQTIRWLLMCWAQHKRETMLKN